MKRIGEQQTIKVLNEGGAIYYFDWFTLNAGYKLMDISGNLIGYITANLFCKLFKLKQIKLVSAGYALNVFKKI